MNQESSQMPLEALTSLAPLKVTSELEEILRELRNRNRVHMFRGRFISGGIVGVSLSRGCGLPYRQSIRLRRGKRVNGRRFRILHKGRLSIRKAPSFLFAKISIRSTNSHIMLPLFS